MKEETQSRDIDLLDVLMMRISRLEEKVAKLQDSQLVYGPTPPKYEPIPYWQNPDWIPPKVT